MAGRRFGGRYSPVTGRPERGAPPGGPFQGRRAGRVSLRARFMYFMPLPLLFAGLGSIGRGDAVGMMAELGGFAGLMLGAWLLNEGLRAEAAFRARAVARPPAAPRKLFAAVLAGLSIGFVGLFALNQGIFESAAFGVVASLAHVISFGLDPMRRKGLDGVDTAASERVARAIEEAESLVRDITGAGARIRDRRIEGRIERLCDQAREVFRVIERDPRDLSRARRFLSIYLVGLRDATRKFADLYGRARDPDARESYEALLTDMEASFATQRTNLLEDNRSDLDVEIEVLRERLQQDGLIAR